MPREDAMRLADCEAMLVTQSEHGMTLVPRNGEAVHVPAHPVKVRDVSGAGDTVAAALAVALAAGADWETALRMANAAAAVAVGKKGTAIVSAAELRRKILPHAYLAAEEKIVARSRTISTRISRNGAGRACAIGFTNGCFDILHPGHVKVLTAARGACDRLIVGLNSDASVRRLKGADRPVQDERARAEVLAALEAVDLVVIFEEDTPIELITRIKPSVLVKGGDYTREQVVGHEVVEAAGGDGRAGRHPPGLQHDRAGPSRAGRRAVTDQATTLARETTAQMLWRRLRSPAAWCETADLFAILTVASLPWSTSLAAIFNAAFLVCMVPFLDVARIPAIAEAPDRSRADRAGPARAGRHAVVGCGLGRRGFYAVNPTVKLLVLPVLLYHFERSPRGHWVFVAFLVSCALLSVMSWLVAFYPDLTLKPDHARARHLRQELHRPEPGIRAVRGRARLSRRACCCARSAIGIAGAA